MNPQPRLTIQMNLEERQRLKRTAVKLCAEGKLAAPTIAALIRAAIQEYLEKHKNECQK